MARKTDEEKRQEADARDSAKFFEQEKREYERRMKLAAETEKTDVVAANDSDESNDGNYDQDESSSEENQEGDEQS